MTHKTSKAVRKLSADSEETIALQNYGWGGSGTAVLKTNAFCSGVVFPSGCSEIIIKTWCRPDNSRF